MTLYNHSDSNKRKTWFLFAAFLAFVMGVAYVFSVAFESPSILYIAVALSFFSAIFSYWFSDKIVLSMSHAKEIQEGEYLEIRRMVENLCISVGMPIPRIYIINDPAPNAFATGRNPKHGVIALTTGLIDILDKAELEGVIAHELSHIRNYDILIATLTTILVGSIVILSDIFLRYAFWGGTSSSKNDDSRLKGIMIIVAIVLSILAPIFAYMMQFTISRKREFLADADGALMTRYPDALASALEKISGDSRDIKAVNRATAHLYISNPIKKKKKAFFAKAFMTHPPVEDRIKALRGMKV